ncbi:hypothetical protein SNOUR_43410 [Streptomyces noursei ATCC 11455]|nr:hypothetical protein SNOUR_00540 [Streptomyces noursei ATCC 11455]ANZ21904.1 hypothetical protein SNOUR_43410 [Streptomyces noursei ATCC 11455]
MCPEVRVLLREADSRVDVAHPEHRVLLVDSDEDTRLPIGDAVASAALINPFGEVTVALAIGIRVGNCEGGETSYGYAVARTCQSNFHVRLQFSMCDGYRL